MNGSRHIEQDDLALFAMQLLDADESASIAQHIESCAECRRELAAVQGDLAVYAHTVDLHSPPALARERLMKAISGMGERCRKLLALKLEGKSFAEIQAVFGVSSVNTVYTWDFRCRQELIEKIQIGMRDREKSE